MAGLMLKLAAGERFIVNGAVLENGDKPSRIRIDDRNARVLRCCDALKPHQVDTPVKQVYYAVQLLITGDLEDCDVLPALYAELDRLDEVFCVVSVGLIATLRGMLNRKNYYSAICHLRQMLEIEARLLAGRNVADDCATGRKVA